MKSRFNQAPLYLAGFVVLALFLSACEKGPGDIRIGEQECDHCRMMISDERFAAQLITSHGRQYAFDAIECLAAYVDIGDGQQLEIEGLWVPDFNTSGNWIPANEATYLQSENIRSPMALNLSAYQTEDEAEEQRSEFNGSLIDWNELRSIVQEAWSDGHQH